MSAPPNLLGGSSTRSTNREPQVDLAFSTCGIRTLWLGAALKRQSSGRGHI